MSLRCFPTAGLMYVFQLLASCCKGALLSYERPHWQATFEHHRSLLRVQLPMLVTESSGPLLLGPASPMATAGPPTPLAVSTKSRVFLVFDRSEPGITHRRVECAICKG